MMAFCFIAQTAFFSVQSPPPPPPPPAALRHTGLKPTLCPTAACKVFGLELGQATVFLVLFLPPSPAPGMPSVSCTQVRQAFQSRCWDHSLNSQVVTDSCTQTFLAR